MKYCLLLGLAMVGLNITLRPAQANALSSAVSLLLLGARTHVTTP